MEEKNLRFSTDLSFANNNSREGELVIIFFEVPPEIMPLIPFQSFITHLVKIPKCSMFTNGKSDTTSCVKN